MNWITGLRSLTNRHGAEAFEKAKVDTQYFAEEVGFKPLYIFPFNTDGEEDAQLRARIDGYTAGVRAGDVVVIQFPNYMGTNYRFERIYIQQMHTRGTRVIGLIHDIDSIRFANQDNADLLPYEKEVLNDFDVLITLNDAMSQALANKGIHTPMVPLYAWGYLIDDIFPRKEFIKELNFAGSLFKSTFLSSYKGNTPIHVWGDNTRAEEITGQKFDESNIDFRGPKEALELMHEFRGGFGLVWDENPNAEFDFYRNYTRINTPHKLSMYLRSGLPVVVWSQSAVAAKVKEWGVGLVIDSLEDIDQELDKMTESDYESYVNNAIKRGNMIGQGLNLKQALLKSVEIVSLLDD